MKKHQNDWRWLDQILNRPHKCLFINIVKYLGNLPAELARLVIGCHNIRQFPILLHNTVEIPDRLITVSRIL